MFMSLLSITICIASSVINALIINVIYFGYTCNTHEKYMFLLLDLYTGR